MSRIKDYFQELKTEMSIVLTFSTGITGMINPLTGWLTSSQLFFTSRDLFMLGVCLFFILVFHWGKKPYLSSVLKNLLTIIGFVLMLIPTINLLRWVIDGPLLPIYSYPLAYLLSLVIYSIKYLLPKNVNPK